MVAACLFPEPEQGSRGKKGFAHRTVSGVGRKMLSKARTVPALAPELADRV
jgi:hypothetical protein